MAFHRSLLNLAKSLSYIKDKPKTAKSEDEGICYGFTIRWIEAYLLGMVEEEVRFEKRCELIRNVPTGMLINKINEAKDNPNEPDQQLKSLNKKIRGDVLGFLESLKLFHDADEFLEVFNKEYISYRDLNEISRIVSSELILEKGGLNLLYSDCFYKDKNDTKRYLDDIAKIIEEISKLTNNYSPVSVFLQDETHAVGLVYKPGTGWIYRDINQEFLDTTSKLDNNAIITDSIFRGFTRPKEAVPANIAFEANFVLTGHDNRTQHLKNALADYTKAHPLSPAIASDPKAASALACMAAQENNTDIIRQLDAFGVDLDRPDKYGMTPAQTAATLGNANVMAELIKAGIDLNQKDKDNNTPAHISAQRGHALVMAEILKGKVDLTQRNKFGFTPIHVAAYKGRDNVIAEFANVGADLNIQNIQGVTPTHLAAQAGHDHVLPVLVEGKANVNLKDINDETPAHFGARQGHFNVIARLSELGADLNIPNVVGDTPLSLAKQQEFQNVIDTIQEITTQFDKEKHKLKHDALLQLKIDMQNKIDSNQFTVKDIFGNETPGVPKTIKDLYAELNSLKLDESALGDKKKINALYQKVCTTLQNNIDHPSSYRTDATIRCYMAWLEQLKVVNNELQKIDAITPQIKKI